MAGPQQVEDPLVVFLNLEHQQVVLLEEMNQLVMKLLPVEQTMEEKILQKVVQLEMKQAIPKVQKVRMQVQVS